MDSFAYLPPRRRIHGRYVFILQYLSVVLIVLTFVVGAFASRHIQRSKPASQGDTQPEFVMGQMASNELFTDGEAELNLEKIETLKTILLNHDIDIEVHLFEETTGPEGLALARSISLYRYLSERGVPASALRILAFPVVRSPQANIIFRRSHGNLDPA